MICKKMKQTTLLDFCWNPDGSHVRHVEGVGKSHVRYVEGVGK